MQTFENIHTLNVEIGRGHVSVRTVPGSTATAEVTGPGASHTDVTVHDGALLISARKALSIGPTREVRVDVTLPEESMLVTRLGSADLVAEGAYSQVRLASGSGDITLANASGDAVLRAGSGDITAQHLGGPAKVSSGSGDVRLHRVDGELDLKTGSGDVRIGHASHEATLASGSGDLTVTRAEADLKLTSGSGALRVGEFPAGNLTATNASGDVSVGIPAGVPVWTDITSVSGRINSDLHSAGQPAEGQAYVALRARTVSGDVTLRQL